MTLFEKASRLLPMQLGCWHRPLHPEIFTWPDDTAYRPVSHLPQLGWTTGRAHDVADTLLAQFHGVRANLQGVMVTREGKEVAVRGGTLSLRCKTAVQVTVTEGEPPFIVKDASDRGANGPYHMVILAVGFGIEVVPFPELPWHSYWRADPSTRSH